MTATLTEGCFLNREQSCFSLKATAEEYCTLAISGDFAGGSFACMPVELACGTVTALQQT